MNEITTQTKLRDPFAKYSELTVQKEAPTDRKAGPLAMTSREIAALTGKRHDNVTVDIVKMLEELGLSVLSFQDTYRDVQNKPQTEYILDQELTYTLVTGYSTVLRNKVVKRWMELEKETNPKDPLLTMDAIPEVKTTVRLVVEAQKAIIRLSNRNCRAEFHDTITNILSGGCEFSMREDADMLLARLASFYEDGVRYYNVEKGYIQTKEGEWRCKPQLNFTLNGHLATAPKIADKERPARPAAYDPFL